jgi:hypothetical protein
MGEEYNPEIFRRVFRKKAIPMSESLEIECGLFTLTILNEFTYSPGSVDNVRRYEREYDFSGEYRPSSRHGLICQQPDGTKHSCILLASRGATGVHEHSVVVVNETCFVAVGDMLCSLSPPDLALNWATKVDHATCFGIHYSPRHDCLLSHGELEIARVGFDGKVVWSSGGADIFSGGFRVIGDYIESIDFYNRVYHFDIASGRSEMMGP